MWVSGEVLITHLRSVSRGERLEDTPRDTAEHLGDDEHGQTVGEDEDEDEGSKGDDGRKHDLFGSESLRSPSVDLIH